MTEKKIASKDASRVLFWSFVVGSLGLVSMTIASAIGEEAIRTLTLTVLTATFVGGGGLLGLLMMQHIAQTHLPDEPIEHDDPLSLSPSSGENLQRGKGFLGMFALTEDASTGDTKNFRRTA